MFNRISTAKPLFTTISCGLLAACGGGSDSNSTTTPETSLQNVTLEFKARVGQQDIQCQLMENAIAGTANTNPEFKDVRMYLSEVELLDNNGVATPLELIQDGKWQYKNVALLDFETGSDSCANGNAALNHQIKGQIPQGNYTGVRFTLGVPAALNHYGIDGDDAISPLDVMGMNWSWQNGHKHLRMDVNGWNIHLGTTGCEVVDATQETIDCASSRPNRPIYQFDDFDAATNVIVFDYQRLVANNDITFNTPNTPPGCMSSSTDPDCQGIYDNLGLDLETGECTAGNCSSSQAWVSVE
ncbi:MULTISPECIES: MbnP family copper-binding protein [unclassified Vibrio]|uniref:MbnP family copper-binding protein n=1 Tax=unclassified Vibrio TaxID=2614977 RepID=UPI002075C0E8|nr:MULTISPECIES: MbnP family copper-binding protein [unclassified Vibrio]MDK9777694.1 metallo-mystery pair system four-Cys motif protein [Vibrio sp. D401a]MDK9801120.1 metallo-mystery pair system four-Cys motif protein [Vibrio sp. D406a]USD50977.1 metallo-mystery pair system four-Cys motif protein [Vibrio sp. SCSIO 43153]